MKVLSIHKNSDVQEKMIMQDILNDVKKYFNKTNNYCSNQQLIGCKDLFRGVMVKEWVMGNQGRIDFPQCNTVVVKICVQHYHECQKRRCVALHNPKVQIEKLKDEVLNIMEEASKDEVEGLKIYVEVHAMNVKNA